MSVASDFFVDKFEDITSLLREGISSDSLLLHDAAPQAADDFDKTFVIETDELSFGFLEDIQRAVQEHPSAELLNTLACLLDATKRTDDVFDAFFSILMSVVEQADPETVEPALHCLSNLAKWSTLKIFEHYNELFDVLTEIISSSAAALEHLKGPAIECIGHFAVTIGPELFEQFREGFLSICFEGLEDGELCASCMAAMEEIMYAYANSELFEVVSEIMGQILDICLEHARIDYTPEYEAIGKIEGAPFPTQFALSMTSLKMLSVAMKTDIDFFNANLEVVLNDAMIQADSCSPDCQMAAAEALARIATIDELPSPEAEEAIMEFTADLTLKLGDLTLRNSNIDVVYKAYESCAIVIQCIDITKNGRQKWTPSNKVRFIFAIF